MPKTEAVRHSVLIVSASEQFVVLAKKSLVGFLTIDIKKSVALARRSFLEKAYDLVVINMPLSDEPGEEFAIDVAERGNASVMLVVPQDICEDVLEHVTDSGVFVLPKPAPRGRLDKAIRFLVATQNRVHRYEKKTLSVEEKMEEIRLVSKAKLVLVEKQQMTEDEAHRYIGKEAMNHGVSRKKIAERILDDLSLN